MKKLLNTLSDKELVVRLEALSRKERHTTLEVLLHLNEVEERGIHVALGYANLFQYVVEKLGYSESAAWRRIATARCIKNYPEIYQLLKDNKLNLTTVSLVAKVLTKENFDDIISEITGKSRKEVEAFIAFYRPKTKIRESIKPVVLVKKADKSGAPKHLEQSNIIPVNFRCESKSAEQVSCEERFEFRFSASEEFKEKFEEVKNILSNKYTKGVSQEQLFLEAMEVFLDKKSPKRREARRQKRAKRVKNKSINKSCTSPTAASRIAPQKLKDQVLARDNFRCAFMGEDGKRCNAMHGLEIDHVRPWALGGGTTAENLRVLCKVHNKHLAQYSFGKEHINKFIEHR